MKSNCWKGVFKLGMQSLALRKGSGGQCLLLEEMCLGGKIIPGAALESCYCDGVLPCLKPLLILRELQLLGKAARAGEGGQGEHMAEKLSFCFARLGSTKNAE